MKKLKHILNVIGVRFVVLLGPVLNDRLYLQWLWRFKMEGKLDLENPKTFNEKLQWLKLYDRKPEYTMMVDKVKVKEYVAEKIGVEYIIPTIAVWSTPEEIDFEVLPNQFVLKCSHNSGGLFICKDKTKVSMNKWNSVLETLRKSLKYDYYKLGREWPYKNVDRKIFAEQYMVDKSDSDLKDYKFFCFNGVPKYVLVATDRSRDVRFDFFDMDFNHVPFRQTYDKLADKKIDRPENFEDMIAVSTTLSQNIPHVRVDLYNINGKIYFGEMTFFNNSGFEGFVPKEWDKQIGDLIKLN